MVEASFAPGRVTVDGGPCELQDDGSIWLEQGEGVAYLSRWLTNACRRGRAVDTWRHGTAGHQQAARPRSFWFSAWFSSRAPCDRVPLNAKRDLSRVEIEMNMYLESGGDVLVRYTGTNTHLRDGRDASGATRRE